MKNIVKKITEFSSSNIIVLIYGIIALSLELLSLLFFNCSAYILNPVFPLLTWFSILVTLILFRSKRLKAVYSFFFLFIQCLLVLGCNYLFLSNGTVFERSMLKQRNDAYATIEQFYLTPGLLVLCIGLLAGYFIFLNIYLRRCRKNGKSKITYQKRHRVITAAINIVLIAGLIFLSVSDNFSKAATYQSMLYKSGNSYQKKGISGNFIYEMLRGDSNTVDISDVSDVEASIYSKRCDISDYNGISKENNLIMILAESFEWYPLTIYSKEQTEQIYPNLSRLMDESVLCDNFYSREKTDTAEALTLIGSNPTGKYVHNDFAENAYPYSLPNLFREHAMEEGEKDLAIRSFHQNNGSFYNRSIAHKSFGFDELVDIKAMKEFGVDNTWDSAKRERNLDSLTMKAMKDEMFPAKKRFFTYWITFSTHGFYNKRDNLSEYYDTFDQLDVFPEGGKYKDYLRTYAAAVADFDKAIGIMLNDLEEKDLLDKTTILIVADHNTYYNGLSNYVKKIDTQFNPELYRVPMIIYDQKLTAAMDASKESRTISKFTTTTDVIPTLLDLFGVPAWDNLYLGSTILNQDKESIIYSRAYNIFITDQYMGYSLNDLKYEAAGVTAETRSDFENRALIHLQKLSVLDKIFYSDYFKEHQYQP
jgi:lipoteichoic acid synthase